jgi:ornithine cyclodeaminase/alanine dehydrogenase-like protein (mu-crystallin family)
LRRSVLQLNADELTSAWSAVDPLRVVRGRFADRDTAPCGRLLPHPATADLVLLEDFRAERRAVLPVAALAALNTAALVTIAVRGLVSPGIVTAAVLGSGLVVQTLLTLLTGQLAGLSHVAVHSPNRRADADPADTAWCRTLDGSGVGWTVADALEDAALGATLVVAAEVTSEPVDVGKPVAGALLVSANGAGFAGRVVDHVTQVYVDEPAAARHAGAPPAVFRQRRRAEEGLWEVLRGARPGRTHVDDVLLVVLNRAHELDVGLACEVHRAALRNGLGRPLDEPWQAYPR